jgi:protein-L-isoaspartate O-methyltransferase
MRTMLDLLRARGVEGDTVLEIGGGIGALQIELLRAGAATAVNVELSGEWEDAARSLLRDAGLQESVERRIGDAVAESAELEAADIVVMERVVCCYPDAEALVGVAADHARRVLVMSFPRDRWWNHVVVRVSNLVCRVRRIAFRSYVHPEAQVETTAESRGLRLAFDKRGAIWRVAAFERLGPAAASIG